ncbi:hypothetical protein AMS68_007139 [Peltaster fructicola]|uniref:Ribonuclease H n=1 Tax=Peltaster fructicola TaxID=286661 RepID=A0A6H0Y3M6_9PEZI|nr:hypothetical protein AMS68_007139 [Peltaster fructicola]
MAERPAHNHAFNTSSLAGSKRKRETSKFYAVRVGRRPGIYPTWEQCAAQVTGVSNPSYKSFTTRSEAEAFVAAKDSATAGAVGKSVKWYGVQVGRNPGVYPTWLATQDQISGYHGAKYKSFKTRAEAEAFVAGPRPHDATPTPDAGTASTQPAAKRTKVPKTKGKDDLSAGDMIDMSNYEPGTAPLPAETEDGFDTAIILDDATGQVRYRTHEERTKMKPQIARPVDNAAVAIYTDGSSLGNGRDSAIAGVGVYFGPNDKRNVSEGLAGNRQTNQRAELTAILRALELAPRDKKVIIYSDSNYAINCVTVWFQKWRTNNWHNASKKPVENKDLVTKIVDLLEDRFEINRHREHDWRSDPSGAGHWERGPAAVKFVWVKGHAVDQGNNAADELATSGARQARELYQLTDDFDG